MGGFDNWFYNTLAGIRPDPEQPGFRHFFLEPHPIPGLEWVRAYHDAPPGRIRSEWRLAGGQFRWEIEIPAGSTATARLPFSCEHRTLGPGRHQIEESGDRTVGQAPQAEPKCRRHPAKSTVPGSGTMASPRAFRR